MARAYFHIDHEVGSTAFGRVYVVTPRNVRDVPTNGRLLEKEHITRGGCSVEDAWPNRCVLKTFRKEEILSSRSSFEEDLEEPEEYFHSLSAHLDRVLKLRHENLVSLLAWFETADTFEFVLEHCTGGDLHDFLTKAMNCAEAERWLSESTVALYTRQILLGLAAMHAHGLFHQDLDASAVLLTTPLPNAVVLIIIFAGAS